LTNFTVLPSAAVLGPVSHVKVMKKGMLRSKTSRTADGFYKKNKKREEDVFFPRHNRTTY